MKEETIISILSKNLKKKSVNHTYCIEKDVTGLVNYPEPQDIIHISYLQS